MKNHFLITFSRVAELGGKVVYSVPPSRELRSKLVQKSFKNPEADGFTKQAYSHIED